MIVIGGTRQALGRCNHICSRVSKQWSADKEPTLLRQPVRNLMAYRSRRLLIDEERQQLEADCKTLGISITCDEAQLRSAYVELAKKYHPDSGSTDVDSEKFSAVDKAYKNMLRKFADERHNLHKVEGEYGLHYETKRREREQREQAEREKKEKAEEEDIQHTAPQHRQYLSFEGYGIGNPFQREKQYKKYRAAKAAENVLDHRIQQVSKNTSTEEKALARDTRAARKTKTSFGMDRLVEDMIQESMARGEFENLSCKGRPLKNESDSNPYIDFTTHKLNQVLIDNGFAPEWILLEKEIRQEIRDLRTELQKRRHMFPEILTALEEQEWNKYVADMKSICDTLNKKILKYNLVVPSLHKQILNFQLDRESDKARKQFSTQLWESVAHEEKARVADLARNRSNVEHSSNSGSVLDILFAMVRKSN